MPSTTPLNWLPGPRNLLNRQCLPSKFQQGAGHPPGKPTPTSPILGPGNRIRDTAVNTTLIRNADWVIAWDEIAGRHVYRCNIDVAFTDATIVFLGRNYPGAADRIIEGTDRLVLPGLIDIHSHPEHEPLYRGVREE